ncbi:MAG: hypothetical protein FWD67_11160 [Betaproteobacteria bacterium]|nr:hypothetical protein [Betaproteobacteria bacterium]
MIALSVSCASQIGAISNPCFFLGARVFSPPFPFGVGIYIAKRTLDATIGVTDSVKTSANEDSAHDALMAGLAGKTYYLRRTRPDTPWLAAKSDAKGGRGQPAYPKNSR